ncbi:MAG: ABC transporter substrate-binding protein [Proteobacteria bacterium]|nr:ABC transporter substrate-binding protein [Pseudomonadota bacterium]
MRPAAFPRSLFSALALVLASLASVAAFTAPCALAAARELRIARQYGIGYLPIMVMEHDRLIEKHAHAAGAGDVTITWRTFGDGSFANDAMIAGDLDIAAGGLGSFLTLWDRTRETLHVDGIAALDSMPMLLNTRNSAVRDIGDFTAADRIAIAGVKISSQAVTLQRAAALRWGDASFARLDHLTVNMPHPVALQALVSGSGDVTAHFASPPFQYEELARRGIRTILDSYEVWGGPQTFVLAWTTEPFRERNPKLYAAFLAALADATAIIRRDPRRAAAIYREMAGGKGMTEDDLVRMLDDPQIRFTLTPQRVAPFAAFRARIGTLRHVPRSWKDLFFPEIHGLDGS